jgi:hypothetical protein
VQPSCACERARCARELQLHVALPLRARQSRDGAQLDGDDARRHGGERRLSDDAPAPDASMLVPSWSLSLCYRTNNISSRTSVFWWRAKRFSNDCKLGGRSGFTGIYVLWCGSKLVSGCVHCGMPFVVHRIEPNCRWAHDNTVIARPEKPSNIDNITIQATCI